MTPSRCSNSATQTTLASSGAAALQNLLGAMRSRVFDEPLIEKVCFKNWLRCWDKRGKRRSSRWQLSMIRIRSGSTMARRLT
jgi:hypothetical protein